MKNIIQSTNAQELIMRNIQLLASAIKSNFVGVIPLISCHHIQKIEIVLVLTCDNNGTSTPNFINTIISSPHPQRGFQLWLWKCSLEDETMWRLLDLLMHLMATLYTKSINPHWSISFNNPDPLRSNV